MSRYILKDLLLDETRATEFRSPSVNRRNFLIGSGAVYLASVTPARADVVVVEKVGRGFRLSLQGRDWLVDPDKFGPGSTVKYQWINATGRYRPGVPTGYDDPPLIAHEIELKNAIFPGLSTRADFKAQLYSRAGEWYLRIGFAEAGWKQKEIAFAGWVDADENARALYRGAYRGGAIVVGNNNNRENKIDPGGHPAQFEIDSTFAAKVTSEPDRGGLRFTSKRFQFGATGIRLSVSDRAGVRLPDNAIGPFSILAFQDARFRDGKADLGSIGRTLNAHIDYDHCEARLVGFRLSGTRPALADALLHLSGDGALALSGPGTGPIGTRLQLERWRIVARANGLDHDARLAGWVARFAHAIEGDRVSIVVHGDGYSTTRQDFELAMGSNAPPRLAFNSHLLAAHVPILGASTADLDFRRSVVRVVLGSSEPDNTAPETVPRDALFQIAGGHAQFKTVLDNADLRVKRTTDLLDLSFGFRRYELNVEDGVSYLFRRIPVAGDGYRNAKPGPRVSGDPDRPLLIVKFHPQYLLEQAFAEDGGSGCAATPGTSTPDNACHVEPGRINLKDITPPGLAQTRLSGPSRIVFSDNAPSSPKGERLSVHYLTDWSDLATVVNKRALPRDATLTDQLDLVGINRLTSRSDAKDMIVANTEPPGPDETAIEPVYRLLISPDSKAQWTTPRRLPTPAAPVMWSAELANPKSTAVRVLWSRDMDLSFLNAGGDDVQAPPALFKSDVKFAASLNQDDRRQLAQMMSVYGIAAMRRIAISGSDDPNGMVFLPQETYCALDPEPKTSVDEPPITARQEGFVLARPFDDSFRLQLSRAATLDARWISEPPAPYPSTNPKKYQRFFDKAFTVEKYIQQTQDGRDTYVEVTYKGFLFPVGHRCALLKVTKREFWPEKRDPGGAPIAYLIQRRYIVVRNPDKTFPAYAQPYASRDFPAKKVTIKTVRTPDLADPEPIAALGGNLPKDDCRPLDAGGSVFWPQVADSRHDKRHDALFEFTVDDGAMVRSPLLFVDNAVAHDAPSMQLVTEYYNALPQQDLLKGDADPQTECFLRVAKLFETPRRYADETKKGECSFKTAAWVFGARGRLNTSVITITKAEKAPNGSIRLTVSSLSSGPTDLRIATSKFVVAGVLGTTEANGQFQVKVISATDKTHVDLVGSTFTNAYVSGGTIGVAGDDFTMDAFMEGRDQPPFYPIMTKGRITVDKVDRLTGAPNTAIEVTFDPIYVKIGFDPTNNPSEIFLDVLRPDIQFDPAGNTAQTGGVANTNSLLAGLARRSGLIGGTRSTALPPQQPCLTRTDGPPACAVVAPAAIAAPGTALVLAPPLAPAPPNPSPQPTQPASPYNMLSALAGRFDPIEFFGGALKDAKLLGIVPLKDILRAVLIAAAPKLVETAQYSVAAASDALWETLKALVKAAQPAASGLVDQINQIEQAANDKLQQLGNDPRMNLAALYPKFSVALDQTKNTAAKIAALKTADFGMPDYQTKENADAIFGLATEFKSDVDAVVAELRRLANDPMPTIVREQLAALQQAWTQLRNFADHPEETIRRLLDPLIAPNAVFEQICGQFDPVTFELVFGVLDDPVGTFTAFPEPAQRTPPTQDQVHEQCMRILKNPAEVLPRLQQALFYEVFAEPFAKLLAGVQQLQQEATGQIAWGRAVIADRITAVLRRGVSEAQALDFPKYGWKILSDMEGAVPLIVVNQPLDQIGPQLEAAAKQSLQNQLESLRQDIKTWRKDARAAADAALDAAHQQALKQIDEATDSTYQDLFARWASAKKLADAYIKLAEKYGLKITHVGTNNETITFEDPPQNELKAIVKEIREVAEQEIRSAAAELEAKLREQAKAAAEGLAQRVFAFANGMIDTALRSAFAVSVASAGQSLTDLCGAAGAGAYAFVRQLAVDLTAKIDPAKITDQLTAINDQLGRLQIPANAPQDARNVILGLHASLTRSLQQFAANVLEFEKIRIKLHPSDPKDDANNLLLFCQQPADLLNLTARSVDLRRRAAQATVDALSQITAAIDALPRLAQASAPAPAGASVVLKSLPSSSTDLNTSLAALADALGQMVMQITSVGEVANSGANWTSVKAKVTQLVADLRSAAVSANDAAADVDAALAPFTALADPNSPIRQQIKATYTPAEALKLARDVLQFTVLNDRRLAGVLLQAAQPLAALWANVLAKTAGSLVTLVDGLTTINTAVDGALDVVIKMIEPPSGAPLSLLSNIVSRDTRAALVNAQAQVRADGTSLSAIRTACAPSPDAKAIATAVTKLKGDWTRNQPGVVQAVQVARGIVDAVASGHFAALFDLAGFEDHLLKAVVDLIPSRVTLNYDFDTELGDFPSGDPIFAMDQENYSAYGPDPARNDLDLRTQITVDLLTGNREVSAVGYIRPFRLHLLGDSLDLATIYFKGARFETTAGGDTKFTADIADSEIGSMLAFLQALQSYLSPSGGNGFYRGIQLIPPQIEVGYRFNKDVLIVGGLIFQNIGFGIGAILPLDGRQAEFRFTFASREKPFFISAPPPTPYGGGGFVGLRANARGVVAFEIQLQFGAAFAIEFGPLLAFVRLSAGIYMLSEAGGRRILEGFVEAVGEGNIACFSVCVLIQIKTSQQSDSSMAGSSTYAFSFKVGFFEVTYSVTAGYRTKGSGGNAQGEMLPQDLAEAFGQALPPARRKAKSKAKSTAARRKVRTVVPAMQDNWKEYRKNFDI